MSNFTTELIKNLANNVSVEEIFRVELKKAFNETFVEIRGGLREETKLFDTEVFREAWLNACLHNRWTLQTPPAVYIFSDRIEIISIGGLPTNYSLDDFYAGRSRPINLELQQIMVQLDYIEQTGHGVPLIVSKYGKNAFDITENFITATIPLKRKKEIIIQNETIFLKPQAKSIEQKVLELIKVDSRITTIALATAIGVCLHHRQKIQQNHSIYRQLLQLFNLRCRQKCNIYAHSRDEIAPN